MGGRLRYTSAWGLSIEASLRGLVAHEAQDYTEWGASGALRFDPGHQGRGLTASIAPTWGTAAGGVSRLWDPHGNLRPGSRRTRVPAATEQRGVIEAELGYGLWPPCRGRGLLTPYARVALTEGTDQAWHMGTRLALAESAEPEHRGRAAGQREGDDGCPRTGAAGHAWDFRRRGRVTYRAAKTASANA